MKYTINDVKNKLEHFGFTLLTKVYAGSRHKLTVKCKNGHEHKKRIDMSSNHIGCVKCDKKNKAHTFDYVKKYIEKNNYILLSNYYKNNRSKLRIMCERGHSFETTFSRFKSGNRCKYCHFDNIKNNFEYVKNKTKEIGFIVLSNESEYINNKSILKVLCNNGHKTLKRFNDIQQKNGCVICEYYFRKGEGGSNWKGGISSINMYLREFIKKSDWYNKSLDYYNHSCIVTGERKNIDLHHVVNFSKLSRIMFNELKLPIHQRVADYTQNDLINMSNKILDLHYKNGPGVPLRKDVHTEFHSLYGNTNNNLDQILIFLSKKMGQNK